MNNKLMNIAIIFLLCLIAILLGLNLLKNAGTLGNTPAPQIVDPKLKPEEDPYIINQVKNTIVKSSASIQQCYNEFLERKPKEFEGRVKMDWRIDDDGDVIHPEMITAEFGDEQFFACMRIAIGKWNFPKPPGGFEKYISHKFFFKKNTEMGESSKSKEKSGK